MSLESVPVLALVICRFLQLGIMVLWIMILFLPCGLVPLFMWLQKFHVCIDTKLCKKGDKRRFCFRCVGKWWW